MSTTDSPGGAKPAEWSLAESTSPADLSAGGDFIMVDGVACAGRHLLVELHGGDGLDDLVRIRNALREAAEAAGATVLHVYVHPFQPQGVAGVAVLAESHISIHSWPEHNYAAVDVFMCGEANPHKAVEVMRRNLGSTRMEVEERLRGRTVAAASLAKGPA